MAAHGKKYRESIKKIDDNKKYSLEEGLKILKEVHYAKFDETVDIAIKLGVNPKHADQMIRGAVVLPHGTGKTARVLVFAKGDKEKEAKEAGADFVGSDDLVEKIKGGWLEFDKTIATPDMMGTVGKLGKILGTRGLMPNPKFGTVTNDVAKAVRDLKGGKIEFKVDKAGIIHTIIGKKSFSEDRLRENFLILIETLLKMKPSSAKGTYIKSIGISTSMSPGIKIDPSYVENILKK